MSSPRGGAALLAGVLAGCDPARPAPSERDASPSPSPPAQPSRVEAPRDPAPPSAAPLVAPTCPTAPDGMVCIPAGPFVRGRDDGPADERPAARVELSTYFIDRFEVTFADYQRCAAQGRCPRARPQYTDYDHPAMPMTGVSWFDADAYCRAQGKALPSEAQWEKAARGPNGALQPWGDEPATCERAVIKDAAGRGCGLRKRFSQPEKGRPWDVGSRPAGSYGLHDMVGNAWEWVADWYAPSFGECGDACAGVDPLGPCAAAPTCPGARRRVVRGGSWYWDASYATATRRRAHSPANVPFHHFGFRCAASPEQAAAFAGR